MLCHEGISLMLNIFREKASIPNFRLIAPVNGKIQEIKVNPEVISSSREPPNPSVNHKS